MITYFSTSPVFLSYLGLYIALFPSRTRLEYMGMFRNCRLWAIHTKGEETTFLCDDRKNRLMSL